MSISYREMLGIHAITDVPVAAQQAIQTLLPKVNNLLAAVDQLLGHHFVAIVTSGYRDLREHRQIYDKINRDRVLHGLAPVPIPAHSHHLEGHAVDIADPTHQLYELLETSPHLLVAAGLWMEHGTRNWTHFQDVPASQTIFIA